MSVCLYINYSDLSECRVCNVPFTLSRDTFTRENYVIYSWNTESNGCGTSYELNKEFNQNDIQNLYAMWKPIIPAYRIPIYGCIQGIDEKSFIVNEDSQEFSPIVANNYNELAIDINGYVVPFKYSTVCTDKGINKNSIFTDNSGAVNNNWNTKFNTRYHIYDGDLPYIDIQLLCKSNPEYKLPTGMIPYDSISFSNGSVSIDENNSDNSVTADNLKTTLNALMSYLKSNSKMGDNVFWTESVQVTS